MALLLPDRGIVAEQPGQGQEPQVGVFAGHRLPVGMDFSLGAIAGAGHLKDAAIDVDFSHGHLVAGQSACLVRADDGGAA